MQINYLMQGRYRYFQLYENVKEKRCNIKKKENMQRVIETDKQNIIKKKKYLNYHPPKITSLAIGVKHYLF